MSAIASFVLLPQSALADLREAVIPKKGLFGGTKDRFHDFLKTRGREAARYRWSGYVLATLLPFLEERGVRLMKSDQDDLSSYICKERRSTCFFLTSSQKSQFLTQLSPDSYQEAELRDFYNKFNACSENDSGKPMLDGIRAIHESLQSVDDNSVVLLHIG